MSELVKVMGIHGMEVSPDARRPPILVADGVSANRQRVDDATYARNALTAARDAARSVCQLCQSCHNTTSYCCCCFCRFQKCVVPQIYTLRTMIASVSQQHYYDAGGDSKLYDIMNVFII